MKTLFLNDSEVLKKVQRIESQWEVQFCYRGGNIHKPSLALFRYIIIVEANPS